MGFLLEVLINGIVVFLVARFIPKIEIRSFVAALIVALLIGIFNPTIGWILRLLFNIGTLGLFWILGLGFIIRLIVTAIIIKLVDVFMSGFKVHGFMPALLLAVIMAIVGTIVGYL